jgi:phenylpropionate dioxygenase-like ring-hydroxylating dioxygenase large terminal subunit
MNLYTLADRLPREACEPAKEWCDAFRTDEVQETPSAHTILGDNVVLFRQDDGRPVALEDACPHKKLPLSMGRREGDHIECGYHGMVVDGSGQCVHIPSQTTIPKKASVRAYPLAEKFGFVWIWMGDASLADEALILDIDDFDNPTWGRTRGDSMVLETSYLNITDNLLDPSHVAWVHRSSFAADGCEDTPLEVKTEDQGVTVHRWILDREPPAYYAKLVKFEGHCDRLQHYEVRFPSIAINKSIFTPAGTKSDNGALHEQAYVMVSYNFLTPVNEHQTKYFWFQHRNTDPDDAAITADISKGTEQAFEEDRLVLEGVERGQQSSESANVVLGIDHGPIRFRQLLEKKIALERES